MAHEISMLSPFDASSISFDLAEHSTHRGGRGEPTHDWYPYIEGYSRQFVEAVLDQHAPKATSLLDPFAGTGTTVMVAASRGLRTGYCEVNPVLQRVVRAKIHAGLLSMPRRRALRNRLLRLAETLRDETRPVKPAADLSESYSAAFGSSVFFKDSTLRDILRLRSLQDKYERENPDLATFLELAVLANLVPCSLLKRAGDVRYKTARELEKGNFNIVASCSDHLRLIAADLPLVSELSVEPIFVSADARSLTACDKYEFDCVVTSPPYLNGTNYFRNTKLELWYTREIRSKADLRAFRDAAITAGINDVTRASTSEAASDAVQECVTMLASNAYDARIPQMVSAYFRDMREVLTGIAKNLAEGGSVCIDIGDSRYGGIHVPTDLLLQSVAETEGLRIRHKSTIRARTSKDGSPLEQFMIVLEGQQEKRRQSEVAPLEDKWAHFKSELPHRFPPYSARNWGSPLHSICSYQGKLKPAIAHFLIGAFSKVGDAICDPFSGSGTLPLEGRLMGRRAYALDLGELGVTITNAKILRPDGARVADLIDDLETYIRSSDLSADAVSSAKRLDFNGTLDEYFEPQTLREILLARKFFCDTEKSTEWYLVQACLLHILHGNRPYALSRRSHPLTPYSPSGPFEYKPLIAKLKEKVSRTLAAWAATPTTETGMCFKADATARWPDEMPKLDLVITSPPFFDSTRFYMTNWMRYWFCGWERDDFEVQTQAFLERRQRQSFKVYEDFFEQCHQKLKGSGLLVMHLGRNAKCDMASELSDVASARFFVDDLFYENVSHCEAHGVRDKGSTVDHSYVVMRPRP